MPWLLLLVHGFGSLSCWSQVQVCSSEALSQALSAGGLVSFGCNGRIDFTSPMVISADTELDAAGHDVVLSGGLLTGLFKVNAGVRFTLRGLVLVDGLSTNGGSIYSAGTLELHRCTFSNNIARAMNGTFGGAVFSSGPVRVKDCIFADNIASATLEGAAGGALYALGPLRMESSFLSGNRASGGNSPFFPTAGMSGSGGAIFAGGTVAITNSTFVGNSALGADAPNSPPPTRGGAALGGAIATSGATLINCSFASNAVVAGFGVAGLCGPTPPLCGGPGNAIGGAMYSSGPSTLYNNLFADPATNNSVAVPSVVGGRNLYGGAELQLLPPAGNGGTTPTMALLPASPAVDSADASACPPTDQRGVVRPAADGCDIGAFEYDGALRFPVFTASFTPALLLSNANGLFTLLISNRADVALDGLALESLLPTNVVVAPGTPTADCAVTIAAPPAQNLLTVPDLSLASHATCEIRVPITSATLGRWSNVTTKAVSPSLGSRSVTQLTTLTVGAPPLAITETESQVGATSGRLNGRVTANGGPAMAWFEWGGTANLGNATALLEVGSAYSQTVFSSPLDNLVAGTPVYFQAVASNAFGISRGAVLSFYPADGIVRNCEEEDLRANLAGNMVRFACDGTVTLTAPLELSGDVTIDGDGHSVSISGSNQVRVFHVPAGVKVTLRGITIADGVSSQGGGICNEGDLTLLDCHILRNEALGTNGLNSSGGPGVGGGIWNSGTLLASNTCFVANFARGGTGAPGASGRWAVDAIDPYGRCRTIVLPTTGTPGFPGGDGQGAGLFNLGTAMLVSATVASNRCIGGLGGTGGAGGRGGCFALGTSGQSGGDGGAGVGGGICNAGVLVFSNTTIHHNEASGGLGGPGGIAWGSFLIGSGSGGRGGNGQGGAIGNAGTNQCENSTLAENLASGGTGGRGGENAAGCANGLRGSGGDGHGGAIHNRGTFGVSFATIWNNTAVAGLASPFTNCSPTFGASNGLAIGTTIRNPGGRVELRDSIVGNLSATDAVAGPILDGGGNLGSDDSAHFTAPDSRNGVDPKLGPLADNGGITLTMIPLTGSPAINAANAIACPPIDQRGVTRPMAGGCDIGAVEWVPVEIRLTSIIKENGTVQLRGRGMPGIPFTLDGAERFRGWEPIGVGVVGSDGTFRIDHVPSLPQFFYRIRSP